LVLSIIFHHLHSTSPSQFTNSESARKARIITAGASMGIALQYINIARDIITDARDSRVYLPTSWLSSLSPPLTPHDVLKAGGKAPGIEKLRERLLDNAFEIYEQNRGTIEELPRTVRGSVRVAVEGYVEIGRVLREGKKVGDGKRATVPVVRRILVGWRALSSPRK
jgi:15-cis-phytoene synthase/lycopene beta-cyclase